MMQDTKRQTIAIAYIPVLHKGYVDFLHTIEEKGVTELYLVGDEILAAHEELDYINRKDRLRAVEQKEMVKAIQAISNLNVSVLDLGIISDLSKEKVSVVTSKEDIGTFVMNTYFPDSEVEYLNIFVRFNRENLGEEKMPEAQVTIKASEFQQKVLQDVLVEADRSFDWWRQVGAALVQNGEVLFVTHNEHMPEEQTPNILGDARSLFKRGIHINYVTSAHAEASLIAEAAKRGISTEGAEMYVTDFPCPYCARVIAKSGIKKLYFMKGYAVLDGDTFLKEEGIEVIKIEV